MIRSKIARALLTAAAILGAATACSTPAVNSDNTPSAQPGSSVAANPTFEGAARAAADAMIPQVKTTLEAAGFKNVTVTSEMETENGQSFVVVSAVAGLDKLLGGCKLNYETLTTRLKLYFDEVITPQHPEGVEVKGAARDSITPISAVNYVALNHSACLAPIATPKAK